MDTSQNSCCLFCPFDPLGHHALTCKSGGDLIVRHNSLRALSGNRVSWHAGSSLDVEGSRARLADMLIHNWEHWISPLHHR